MRNSFLLIILFLSSVSGFSQKKLEALKDTVVWNETKQLVKKDFKGKPVKGSFYGMTVSGIMLDTKQEYGVIKCIVQAVFFRRDSWLKTDSAYERNHEQKHFDICEIYARKLRQKIATANLKKSKKLNNELDRLYKEVNRALDKEQDRYDKETNHSINTEQQELWDKKIASELEELKDFSSIEVSISDK